MNRQEFEHIIRACGAATSRKELLIVGSQAILGSVPDSRRDLRVSLELDVSPIPFSEEAVAIIDGNIGELSQFHKNFHIYAHAVGPDTATVPEDYRTRLVTVTVGGVSAHCVSPADLAYSKLAAGREKDMEFVAGLLHHKIVRQVGASEANRGLKALADASEITGLPRDNFEIHEISKVEFERLRA